VKLASISSDHSLCRPANNATDQPPKPVDRQLHFQVFKSKFELLQLDIKEVLQKNVPQWKADPLSFWGHRVDSLSQLPLPAAVQRLNGYLEGFEEDSIVSPMRRRLSLVMLHHFRKAVESRIGDLVRKSRITVKRGTTFRSISFSVVSNLFYELGKRDICVARLRAGERYGTLPIGIPLALGNVPSTGM
jgi:hypothetical protein